MTARSRRGSAAASILGRPGERRVVQGTLTFLKRPARAVAILAHAVPVRKGGGSFASIKHSAPIARHWSETLSPERGFALASVRNIHKRWIA